jgi:hypothetical protein
MVLISRDHLGRRSPHGFGLLAPPVPVAVVDVAAAAAAVAGFDSAVWNKGLTRKVQDAMNF